MAQVTTRDRDIITKSFRMLTRGIAPSELLEKLDWDRYFNVFSSATGDNRYINPVTQFSPATDPRYGRFMVTQEGGMGSLYKEMFEDNVTLLTLTAGVPQFAGLLSFITNMFSPTAAIIANKGRAPGPAFYMGQAAGSIAFVGMQAISIGTQFLAFLMDSPRNCFWTVKPAMGAYTMAATGVLNDLMVKLGYIDPILPKRAQEQNDPLYGLKPDYDNTRSVAQMSVLMPDVVNSDGTIDLMRLVMKGTRKHRVMLKKLAELDNDTLITTPDEKFDRIKQMVEEVTFGTEVMSGSSSQEYIEQEMGTVGRVRGDTEGNYTEQDSAFYNESAYNNISNTDQAVTSVGVSGAAAGDSGAAMQTMGTAGSYGTNTTPVNPNERTGRPTAATPDASAKVTVADGQQAYYEDNPNDRTWAGDIMDLVQTAFYGGLDAITFRVEGNQGAVTDSFSNNHGPSPMAEKFNSIVSSVNDFKFDIAGGATGIGIIDGVVNMVKEAAIGALSGSVIGNIPLAMANNSYVKIPEHWTGSTSNLHTESYEMNFHCNYAHPYEQVMKIWVPFALILPLVAPMTSGGSSSTSPFMVKAFCKSRQIIRTGMVTAARFTFGEGEAGWTRDRRPLNLKIVLDITDLDPLVSIPIDRSMSLLDLTNPAAVAQRLFTDDTAYNNYFARLTGMDYLDTVLRYSKINRQLTNIVVDMKTSMRADNFASKISDSIVGDLGRIFTKPIAR
jgi:hypothetical protein